MHLSFNIYNLHFKDLYLQATTCTRVKRVLNNNMFRFPNRPAGLLLPRRVRCQPLTASRCNTAFVRGFAWAGFADRWSVLFPAPRARGTLPAPAGACSFSPPHPALSTAAAPRSAQPRGGCRSFSAAGWGAMLPSNTKFPRTPSPAATRRGRPPHGSPWGWVPPGCGPPAAAAARGTDGQAPAAAAAPAGSARLTPAGSRGGRCLHAPPPRRLPGGWRAAGRGEAGAAAAGRRAPLPPPVRGAGAAAAATGRSRRPRAEGGGRWVTPALRGPAGALPPRPGRQARRGGTGPARPGLRRAVSPRRKAGARPGGGGGRRRPHGGPGRPRGARSRTYVGAWVGLGGLPRSRSRE